MAAGCGSGRYGWVSVYRWFIMCLWIAVLVELVKFLACVVKCQCLQTVYNVPLDSSIGRTCQVLSMCSEIMMFYVFRKVHQNTRTDCVRISIVVILATVVCQNISKSCFYISPTD